MNNKANKPTHEIRLGRVRATIWQNDTDSGPRYNVTLSRLYKSEEGWRDSGSFGRDDLPLVAKVADLVHTWIFEQTGERPNQQEQAEAEEAEETVEPPPSRTVSSAFGRRRR